MKKILVTGADGLLGNNLVRLLLKRKYVVKVFLESGKSMGYLADLPIEVNYGNILITSEVRGAVKGCDIVIHAAALTNTWPTQGPRYFEVNVEGTRNVVEAVKEFGISRFIHIGTANSYGAGPSGNPGTEVSQFIGDKYKLDYITSKYRAHELVINEIQNNQLPALILNPTFMIGPFDVKPSSGKMIIAIAHGKVLGFSKGGRNFSYVKDTATAVANAIEMGRIGEGYILGNANLSYRDMFDIIAGTVGVKPPSIKLPPFVVNAYGLFAGIIGKLTGREPTVNYPQARMSNEEHFYDSSKAIKELGLPQTPVETAIEEAVDWFNKVGYLP